MTTEQMDKSAWLNRLYYLKLKVNSLYSLKESERNQARTFIEMMPVRESGMISKECEKIIEDNLKADEEKYLKLMRLYNEVRQEIEDTIEKIDDYELQVILTSHYLEHKTWNVIAKENFYGLRTIKYKHLKALDLIYLKKEAA